MNPYDSLHASVVHNKNKKPKVKDSIYAARQGMNNNTLHSLLPIDPIDPFIPYI